MRTRFAGRSRDRSKQPAFAPSRCGAAIALILCITVVAACISIVFTSRAYAQSGDDLFDECRSVHGSEVITRDDIVAGGLVRLSDLLHRADRWSTASIDGYTWHAQTSGLSPLSNPRWDVLVDGVPAEIRLFGTQSLDALPLHINEVECVELISRPHVSAGELREAGTLHIRTRRPDQGMTLAASVAARNEVNDPGPFAYTPLASRNIDRIGPIGTGSIEIRSAGRYARLAAKVDEFHFTDERVDLRAKQLYNADSKPRIYTAAIAVSAGIESRHGTQRILAGRGETNDLLFFETFGLEIPAVRHVDFAKAGGFLRLGGSELHYHGSYVSHEFRERQNSGDIDLDFRKRIVSGGMESRVGAGPVRFAIGGSLDVVDAQTRQQLFDSRTMITRLFGEAVASMGGVVDASLFGAWIQVDERPVFSVMPSVHVTLPYQMWIAAGASVSRRTLATDATLWRWTQFGYSLPERTIPADDPDQEETKAGHIAPLIEWPAPRLFTVDLDVGGNPWQGVEVLIGTYMRRSYADYFAWHDISLHEESSGFLTNSTLVNFVGGEMIGVHGRVGLDLLPGFSQQISYVAESILSEDDRFFHSHARVPSHRAALTTTFAPNDRFSLHARARYQASTSWTEYAAASAASNGLYLWHLPHRILVDVAATKRLWRDHLIANISVRNLLNEPYRAHPAGAVFNLSFHFAVRLSFNSEAGF